MGGVTRGDSFCVGGAFVGYVSVGGATGRDSLFFVGGVTRGDSLLKFLIIQSTKRVSKESEIIGL